MTRARNSANLASHGNLFVDITNDRTGIGSVVPGQSLHVAGTAGFHADTTFTGDLYNATWDRSTNSLNFADSAQLKLGTGGDVKLYHNGSHSFFTNATGNFHIRTDTLKLEDQSNGHSYITAVTDGAVDLYHDNSKKFETTAYGTNTTGTAVNDGLVVAGVATVTTMNVTGVLTYDDVTSVDSVGIVTARQGVDITGSNLTMHSAGRIFVGNGGNETNPMFANISDTNTGIFFPAADNLAITTGGAERLRILSSGELRIISSGSNNDPAHLRLHCEDASIVANDGIGQIRFAGRDSGGTAVSRTGALIQGTAAATWDTGQTTGYSATHLDFFTQDNSGTDTVAAGARLRIDSSGNVLVGTTTSAGKLTVDSGTSNTCATFQSSDSGAGINVKDNSARSSIEQNGTTLKISSDTGAEHANSDIRLQVDGSTKMLIDSNANVAINKTSGISAKLHIGDSSNDAALSQLIKLGNDSSNSGTGSQINMGAAHGNESTAACIAGFYDGTGTSFIVKTTGTYANQSTVGERLRITSSGQVRAGDESSSDRTSYRHQFSSTAGAGDVLSLQNPSNSDGQGIGLGFWARNTNNAAIEVAKIKAVADETQANSTQAGSLRFLTNIGASMGERMRIDSSGRVGINKFTHADAASALTIRNGASNSEHSILDIVCNDNETSRIYFSEDSNTGNGSIRYVYTSDENYMSFYTSGTGSSNERFRIENNGQLWLYANGGDNQLNSKRIGTTSSNGDYFFHLTAINHNNDNVGTLGFHRDTANDDARFIIKTKITGGSNIERFRIDSTGRIKLFPAGDTGNGTSGVPLYLQVQTNVTDINTPTGGSDQTGMFRIEDRGGTSNRYHGLELRNRNSGDIRLLNRDRGASNYADFVVAVDDGGQFTGSGTIRDYFRIKSEGLIQCGTLSGNFHVMASTRDGSSSQRAAQSAWEIKKTLGPAARTGYYYLKNPYDSTTSQWWCDMDTDGGGWILVAHTGDGQMAAQSTSAGNHWFSRSNKGGFDTVGSGYYKGGGYWRGSGGAWAENTCGQLMWDVRTQDSQYDNYSNAKVVFNWGTDQAIPTGASGYSNIPNAGNRRLNEWCYEVVGAPGFNPSNYHQNTRNNTINGGNHFTEHMVMSWCFRGTGGGGDDGDSGPYWMIGSHHDGLHQHYEEGLSGSDGVYGDGGYYVVSNEDTGWGGGGSNDGYPRIGRHTNTGFCNVWLR